MWFGVVTLLPQMFQALEYGVIGRSLQQGIIQLSCWNPRDFSLNRHKNVDAPPYGGGPGMVMMAQPLSDAVKAAQQAAPTTATVVYLSPQGQPFRQSSAKQFVAQGSIILVAGRYEGVDQRFLQTAVDLEWSIGDYIISGGELAAMVVIDAMSRLVPGVVKQTASVWQDSLSSGLLKYPQYTRPKEFAGHTVPEVLISGKHQAIELWRLQQSLGVTWLKRPDLLEQYQLTQYEQVLLNEFKRGHY